MISDLLNIIAPTLAILTSIVATLIGFIVARLSVREGQREGVTLFSLEQQKSELEKQRNELEKQEQMLIWQMEAATLAKEDPRLAIVTAYQGMEIELQRNPRYSKERLEEFDKQKIRDFYDLIILKDLLGIEAAEDVKNMRELRNRVVHGEVNQEEVSSDKVMEYVQKAIFLSKIISSSEHNIEKI
jgi:hypothetical protein